MKKSKDEEIAKLYNEGMSVAGIATLSNLSEDTIRNGLHKGKIKVDWTHRNRRTTLEDEEEINRLQATGLTVPQIAAVLKLSRGQVRYTSVNKRIRYRGPASKELLGELRSVQRKSLRSISNTLQISPETVRKWLKRYNLTKPKLTKEVLEKLYTQEEKSREEIAEMRSISPIRVERLLRQYKIPLRRKKKVVTIPVKERKPIPKETLEASYRDQTKSVLTVCKELGITPRALYSKLRKYNIPKKKQAYASQLLKDVPRHLDP